MRPYKQAKKALSRRDLDAFFDLIWSEDELYQADKKGKHRIVDLLLEDKSSEELFERLFTERGLSPELDTGDPFAPMPILRYCVQHDREELARLVLEQGARVDRVDEQGQGLVHEAVGVGSAKLVRLLAQFGADINLDTLDRGDGQRAPLHLACDQGNLEVVETLLELGADVTATNWRGESGLHIAAFAKHPEVIAALLGQDGIDVDLERGDGKTALHLAADRRQTDAVALLLRAGAEVNPRDEDGWTPLSYACARGDSDITELLLANGADRYATTARDVRIRGTEIPEGSSAQDIARLLGQRRIEEVLSDPPEDGVSLDEILANYPGFQE
jgi:ankyrin repeat protein